MDREACSAAFDNLTSLEKTFHKAADKQQLKQDLKQYLNTLSLDKQTALLGRIEQALLGEFANMPSPTTLKITEVTSDLLSIFKHVAQERKENGDALIEALDNAVEIAKFVTEAQGKAASPILKNIVSHVENMSPADHQSPYALICEIHTGYHASLADLAAKKTTSKEAKKGNDKKP